MQDNVTINGYRVIKHDRAGALVERYEQETPVPIVFTTIRKGEPGPASRFSPLVDVSGPFRYYAGVELWCGKEQYRIDISELSAAIEFLRRMSNR